MNYLSQKTFSQPLSMSGSGGKRWKEKSLLSRISKFSIKKNQTYYYKGSVTKNCAKINFVCHLNWAKEHPSSGRILFLCVSMRVFLHEVNIWIIGLSEAYCLYQCKWPAQVNIRLFHSYTTACVGVSLYQPHRWQVESKALALHHGKKVGIFSVENGGRGWGSLWEPVRSAQLLPRHPLQALGWGHLRICISFVWLRRHG